MVRMIRDGDRSVGWGVDDACLLGVSRRQGLVVAVTYLAWPGRAFGQAVTQGLALGQAQPQLINAVRAFAGGATVKPGGIRFDVAALVENGNTVPIEVDVASPMTADDHVRSIALFNERNPNADVMVMQLTPTCGRARVASRIRLATSQTVIAVAQRSDGSFIGASVDVIVTLAACVEEAPSRS